MPFTPISIFFNPLSKVYQAFSNFFSLTLINLIYFPKIHKPSTTIHKPSTKNVNAKSMLHNPNSFSFIPLSKNINPFLKNVNAVSKIITKKTSPFIPKQSKVLNQFVFIFKFINLQICILPVSMYCITHDSRCIFTTHEKQQKVINIKAPILNSLP